MCVLYDILVFANMRHAPDQLYGRTDDQHETVDGWAISMLPFVALCRVLRCVALCFVLCVACCVLCGAYCVFGVAFCATSSV